MMHRAAALALLAIVAGCYAKRSAPLPTIPARLSVECYTPGPDDYSVTLVVRDTTYTDTAWLRPILEGVGRHWLVELPLPKRAVDVAVTLFRDDTPPVTRIVRASGNRDFDVRALDAVEAALADSDRVLTPRYARDTLDLLVRFGSRDVENALAQTWLSVARPPRPRGDNPQPDYPADARAGQIVVAVFTVDSLGGVDPSSIEIIQATDDAYAAAVRAVLPRWRFTPSMVRGCRVAREVRWVFGDAPRGG